MPFHNNARFVAQLLTAVLMPLALFTPLSGRAAGKTVPPQQRETFIPLGFYWPGEASFRESKTLAERWRKIDVALAGMARHHINAVWIVNENTDWAAELSRHAAKYGIYIVAATNQLEGKIDWIRKGDHEKLVAQTMQDWGDAPRPIAWGLSDEAPNDLFPEMKTYVTDWNKYAPNDPTTIVEPWKNVAVSSRLPLTTFTSDTYAFFSPGNPLGYLMGGDWIPWEIVTQHVVAANARPWMMGQSMQEPMGPYTYDAQGNVVYLPGSFPHYIMPTPAQITWQAWSAFALGAKGMFYYHYSLPQVPRPDAKIRDEFSHFTFPMLAKAPTDSHAPMGVVYQDGRTTPQYEALGTAFGQLARLSPTLAPLKPATLHEAWPASSSDGGALATVLLHPQTGKRYLMVVAPYTGTGSQTVRVTLGPHIMGLTNVLTRRKVSVPRAGQLRQASVALMPGNGALFACTVDRGNLPMGYADDFSSDKYKQDAVSTTNVTRDEPATGFRLTTAENGSAENASGAGASVVYDTSKLFGSVPAGGVRLLTYSGSGGVTWWVSDDNQSYRLLSRGDFERVIPFPERYVRVALSAGGSLSRFAITQWKRPAKAR